MLFRMRSIQATYPIAAVVALAVVPLASKPASASPYWVSLMPLPTPREAR
jgi:hypothetical protein